MRLTRIAPTALPTLLAVLACASCICANVAGASARADTSAGATGGARPAPTASPAPARTKVHRTGLATWFGPGFYGQTTACGQTLTPAVVGVANRTLPCGTLVRVTYHGHALVVPVLDR